MQNGATRSRRKLLMTGDPAGHQHSGVSLQVRPAHLGKQVLADRHAEFVIVVFVAEASRHTAALNRRSYNVETRRPQKFDGLRCGIAGLLLAVSVVEQPGSKTRLGRWKQFRKVETGFSGDVPHCLQRLKAVRRQSYNCLLYT